MTIIEEHRRFIGLRTACIVCCGVILVAAGGAGAQPQQEEPPADPSEPVQEEPDEAPVEPVYPVDTFVLEYVRPSDAHPTLEALAAAPFLLGRRGTEFVAPGVGETVIATSIHELNAMGFKEIRYSGLQHILESLVAELNRRNLISVFVAPDPAQIDETGKDLREGDTTLRLLIATGVVTEVRTLASGERVPDDISERERINHPLHEPILRRSPIKPGDQIDEEEGEIDLIRKDVLDRYIFHLSRHPGRRVDVALSPADEPGGVLLDYHVTENRPLVLYAQVSNTGTEQTDRWRERFGLIHNQLTNNDDIFSLEYATTNFDESHAVTGSYEAPFPGNDRVRWRVYGGWNQFTASEVGFFDDTFFGESWTVGAEVAANVYQDRELFVDVVGGARYQDIEVDNRAFGIQGEEDFFIPYVGARLERRTEWYGTFGSLMFEFQSGDINDVNQNDLNRLGRLFPDEDWVVMQWNLAHAFYLEPLLNWREWADPTTPKSSTLAHEIALSFRGQYSFGYRLIPQEEEVVGGLYSVRGYEESIAAGDTVLIGSIEYRFHLPHALGVEPQPGRFFNQPFRWAPQYVYGQPDWDLILKAFLDGGYAMNEDRLSFEEDEELIGTGIGIELQLRRNLNVRLDWGFALKGTEAGNTDAGSNRVHFVATILF